jgi:Ca-activated chloride channel family protein
VGDAPGSDGVTLRLAAPLLLLVGLPLALLVLLRVRALPSTLVATRRRLVQGLLVLAALAAALAVARLERGTALDRVAIVFAVDRSRSVERAGSDGAEASLARVRGSLDGMRSDDLAGLVAFGAESATEVLPQPMPDFTTLRASIPRDGTDIGGAIRRSLAELPEGYAGRIVLISDGVETDGDALLAAQLAAGRGVPIDVLPVERAPAPEIAVERVQVPPLADPGEPIEIRAVTRASVEAEVRVRVLRDGVPIAEADTRLAAGTDVLTLRELAPAPGVHRYDVLVEPLDAALDAASENNEGGAFVRVSGASRALVVSERPDEAAALAASLTRAGLEVSSVGPAGMPIDLAEMAGLDLIVLSDLDARQLAESQMEALRAYVRDLGGGLLMLGVRDAFGLGGYASTPVEEALPATFDLRRRRDRASLAMVIAIDRSGSMSVEVSPGVMKLDLANEAAARSAALLAPQDRIAVAHVDTGVTWTVPMTVVEQPEAIAGRVRRAGPGGGGIFVDVALEAAYRALAAEPTQLRHFLLFSDGSDSEQMVESRRLVAGALREHGITTSVVSMGAGPDSPELETLSRIGGGRFYVVDDLRELPRIFTQETVEASRAAVVEEAFVPIRGNPSPVTDGIDLEGAPALGGYVVVNARPRASVLLAASEEDPLLLTWQFGVGRSAVFASDAGASFGRPWLGWSGRDALFGQLGRFLSRAPASADAELFVATSGGTGRVRVEALDADGRFRNDLDLAAVVSGPDGSATTVPVAQTGPGRYEARFDASVPGPYLVTVRELDADGTGALVGSVGVVRARGDELRGEGTNRELLARIAGVSGGEVRSELGALFRERPAPVWAWSPLWRPLVLASVLMLLASVAARRLVTPRWLAERLRGRVPAQASSGAPVRDVPPRTVGSAPAPELPAAASSPGVPPAAPPPGGAADAPPPPADSPPRPAASPPPASLAESLLARRRGRKR